MFNLFIDGVITVWVACIMNAGVCLNVENVGQCKVSSFLLVDDAVPIAESEE